jgi:uncharacterized iron-regulated membrane protein
MPPSLDRHAAPPRKLRIWAARAHRYLGLALLAFLLLAGLTGSMLAFYPQLNALSAPALFQASPPAGATNLLDPLALREHLLRQLPGVRANQLPLRVESGRTVMFPVVPAQPEGDDEVYVNPYSGAVQGQRRWGDIGQGNRNLLPYLYRIHYCLTVDGSGQILLGGVAMLWLIASALGLVLTVPSTGRNAAARWRLWRTALRPQCSGGALRISFSLHRAAGLWLCPMLMVMAWSAVGLTLNGQVYQPVMRTLLGSEKPVVQPLAQPRPKPGMTWPQALSTARDLMREQLHARGELVEWEDALIYDPARGAFAYRVHTSADIGIRRAHTTIWLDGESGSLRAFQPTAGATAGDTVSAWLFALHRADLGGTAYRWFECLFGLVLSGLVLSGGIVWWKKRHARRLRHY